LTFLVTVRSTSLRPLHSWHTLGINSPVPPQVLQVATLTNWPRMDCCTRRTSPVPLQVVQAMGRVPGSAPLPPHVAHVSGRRYSISRSAPKMASSKVMVRS